uniref:Putative secreted protein n=1 Tax=Ixodes ricinus TaxID=34613 RepID=A0A6B0U6X2_IXORI
MVKSRLVNGWIIITSLVSWVGSSCTQAIVTPPSSESLKRSRKVPLQPCRSMSSAWRRPTKPHTTLSFHSALRCSRVTFMMA